MKKTIILLIFLSLSEVTYGNDQVPLKDFHYFLGPPSKNVEVERKESKIKLMLYRADKPRQNTYNYYRYSPHISGREYLDCSYYKYVDCRNYTFCRCWQCRNYVYDFEDN